MLHQTVSVLRATGDNVQMVKRHKQNLTIYRLFLVLVASYVNLTNNRSEASVGTYRMMPAQNRSHNHTHRVALSHSFH